MLAAEGGGGGSADTRGASGKGFDTPFNQKGLEDLKGMVEGSNIQAVRDVAQNWMDVHDHLVTGDDSILSKFNKAVTKVLQHWTGTSAEQFLKAANEISSNISTGAQYPSAVSNQMAQVAQTLHDVYQALSQMEEPSLMDRAMDRGKDFLGSDGGKVTAVAAVVNPVSGLISGGASLLGIGGNSGRSDAQLNADLANPNMDTATALKRNAGQLSAGREVALQAAIQMETLGTTYKRAAATLGDPSSNVDETIDESKDKSKNSGTGYTGGGTGGLNTGGTSSHVSTGNYKSPSTGDGSGITPLTTTMPSIDDSSPMTISPKRIDTGSSSPAIGTSLDSFGTGSGSGSGSGGTSGLGGSSGSYGGVGSGGSSGSGGLGSTSSLGGSGSGTSGVSGVGGVSAAGLGGSSAAGRTGTGAGRTGMPGAGGGAGAGKAGAGGSTGRGALARQKGGVVGAAKGKSGTGAQGGSGLHRSRGGTQAGASGKSGRGMAGAPGAHGRGKGDGEGREGERPDYLIEDEETWTPERNVAPRVIE
ncbi:MAG: hypothetical protein QOF44_2699 [Streptomyces sp.]|nr:hypothetical protein [Streptomyces sp.]